MPKKKKQIISKQKKLKCSCQQKNLNFKNINKIKIHIFGHSLYLNMEIMKYLTSKMKSLRMREI